MLKTLYVIAIGLLFAAVVGLGIEAFYPQPKYPEYPRELNYPGTNGYTEEQKAAQDKFDEENKTFMKRMDTYNRDVSLILIGFALVILAASIIWVGGIEVIGDGLTLGGVFTLLYGLGRALAGGDEKVRFLAVAFGLVVLVFLAYWKYIRPNQQKTTPQS
jgi:hypothetical protein